MIWVIYSGWQNLSVFSLPLQKECKVIVAVVILPLIFLAIIWLKVMIGSGRCYYSIILKHRQIVFYPFHRTYTSIS